MFKGDMLLKLKNRIEFFLNHMDNNYRSIHLRILYLLPYPLIKFLKYNVLIKAHVIERCWV